MNVLKLFNIFFTKLAFPFKQKMEKPTSLFNIRSIQKNKEMKLSFFFFCPANLNV